MPDDVSARREMISTYSKAVAQARREIEQAHDRLKARIATHDRLQAQLDALLRGDEVVVVTRSGRTRFAAVEHSSDCQCVPCGTLRLARDIQRLPEKDR